MSIYYVPGIFPTGSSSHLIHWPLALLFLPCSLLLPWLSAWLSPILVNCHLLREVLPDHPVLCPWPPPSGFLKPLTQLDAVLFACLLSALPLLLSINALKAAFFFFFLSCSLLYLKYLEWGLAHSRCSIKLWDW